MCTAFLAGGAVGAAGATLKPDLHTRNTKGNSSNNSFFGVRLVFKRGYVRCTTAADIQFSLLFFILFRDAVYTMRV